MKFFSLIYQGELHNANEDKIIPAENYSILVEASEILEKAKEDAEALKKETELLCEELEQKAEERGFQRGLESLNEHILGFEREIRRLRHETQQAILPIALKAVKKLISKELEIHPETIVDIVIQALSPVVQNHRITIFVNKADKEILDSNKDQVRSILEQVQSFSIQEDPDIAPGGCKIQTETGIINATLDNQLRALEAAFEKYMRH